MINQTESLYGFLSWIVNDSRRHTLGGGFHGGALHVELASFCEANNLPYLEDGWEENVVFPKSLKMTELGRRLCRKGYRKK